MKKWEFIYVENLVWVKKNVNNRIVTQDYKYIRKSKSSMLIFRKIEPRDSKVHLLLVLCISLVCGVILLNSQFFFAAILY